LGKIGGAMRAACTLVFDTFAVRGLVHGGGLPSSDCGDPPKFAGHFIDYYANGSNSRFLMTLFNFRNRQCGYYAIVIIFLDAVCLMKIGLY
jgi:hypothetical protein